MMMTMPKTTVITNNGPCKWISAGFLRSVYCIDSCYQYLHMELDIDVVSLFYLLSFHQYCVNMGMVDSFVS